MIPDDVHSPFDLLGLSPRERAVVQAAVDGSTDEQIAQALDLSVSTVNSYWVRIRGKLGHLSRAEIIGNVLRERFRLDSAEMVGRLAAVTEEARLSEEGLAQANADIRAISGDSWHFAALECLPAAAMVLREPGLIVYANSEVRCLCGAAPGALEGSPVWKLTVPEHQERRERQFRAFFAQAAPTRLTVGLRNPFYALRADGTNFRAVLVTEPLRTTGGGLVTATLRAFMPDAHEGMDELLRPHVPPVA